MNVNFDTIAETVRKAFDFEVMKLPLSGADNHYTPWYGLFRDDTGDYVGSGSISERYVPHTSDDVCALVEAAANIFDGEVDLQCHFKDGHYVGGETGIINVKKYELTPNILENKNDYEFLQWDLEVGDCIYFDMRTLHGGLNSVTPKKDVHRYTLRMAKEDSKIIYRGDWAKEERAIMEENGYKNGDDLSGKMFPTLYKVD